MREPDDAPWTTIKKNSSLRPPLLRKNLMERKTRAEISRAGFCFFNRLSL